MTTFLFDISGVLTVLALVNRIQIVRRIAGIYKKLFFSFSTYSVFLLKLCCSLLIVCNTGSCRCKVRKLAFKSALAAKAQADEIIVIDGLKMDEIKTAKIASMLKALNADKALIVTAENDTNIYKSARNIKNVSVSYVDVLNTYEILKHDKFVVAKEAIAKIEEVLA